MLIKRHNAGNERRLIRVVHVALCVMGAATAGGCSMFAPALSIWTSSEAIEEVSQFGPDREPAGGQWFARVMEPENIPRECRHALSERFDFVVVRTRGQWRRLVAATTLDPEQPAPSFLRGPVVGLMCRSGEAPLHRWPIIIRSARNRRGVVLLSAQYREGFYRPLKVPPYLHLVWLPGAESVIGLKLNSLLFGFNVEIDDLHAAGIR